MTGRENGSAGIVRGVRAVQRGGRPTSNAALAHIHMRVCALVHVWF